MYQARLYQATWKYDPTSNAPEDFNARIGKVLSKGVYQHADALHAPGSGSTSKVMLGRRSASDNLDDTNDTMQHKPLESTLASPGYVWVDAQGTALMNTSSPRDTRAPAASIAPAQTDFVPLSMSKTGKRINPGIMPQYSKIPVSTMAAHFSWAPDEPVNLRYHLKKTDFSEYNEVAARFMNNMVTAKS
ncbi:hypothetical protein WJX72_003163 [[Myrmecia] bisecta]|uniref:Uncharacterized protein n=1 Tax=[Myrmecia] bisecta TaxID=41462 RepID=A0AAW1Q3M3_9CHLO